VEDPGVVEQGELFAASFNSATAVKPWKTLTQAEMQAIREEASIRPRR